MIIIITFLFCIFAVNQVTAYNITVFVDRLQGNSFIPVSVNLLDSEDSSDLGPKEYEIIFNRDVDEEHDFPIKFIFHTNDWRALNSKPGALNTVTLCKADLRTIEGTTASLVARVLGIEKDPPCPIKKGTRNIRESMFEIDRDDYYLLLFDPLIGTDNIYLEVTTDDHFLAMITSGYVEKD